MVRYALGTTNQAKRKAVELATGMEPICLSVPSGVADQPLSEDETIRGAIHRAKQALAQVPEATIGLGLEGGLTYDDVYTEMWYLISICAAWDGQQLSIGKGLAFPIPFHIGERVKKEQIELRTVIDELAGMEGSNQRGGAYGLLTNNRIVRANVFCEAVIAALTPFHSSFYQPK
ncbi:DUF84 family protein [Brevibacillus migulae]|uniref:DUF84 family protein n=1 Tax=Brevibacillus migulae TaxID=1644114 RepID=UPI00106E2BCB|nr:inosine/xanthosine triphosphatase [Brevibacillus migulae]